MYLFSVFRGILPAIFRRFSKKLSTSVVVHQTIFYQIIKINKTQLLLKYFFGKLMHMAERIYEFWLPLWYLQTLLKDMLECAQKISTAFEYSRQAAYNQSMGFIINISHA
jgi:hypothetical protein